MGTARGYHRPVVSVAQRLRKARAPAADGELRLTRNPGVEVFLWSRGLVWLGLLFAYLWFEPKPPPLAAEFDDEHLHDVGWVVDVWARWDSAWFVRIAEDGYADDQRAAFFPLYPLVTGLVGRALGGHYVLAGFLLSLAATLAAFTLLYRLAEERLGPDGARRALVYLAVFPATLFLGAVYSEGLFLLLAVAAFFLAERRRFAAAAAVAGLAMLTRGAGLALLPALGVLAWRAPDRPRALASLALAPLVYAAHPLILWWRLGEPFAFLDAQDVWQRRLTWLGPLQGIWDGTRAAVAGLRDVVDGAGGRVYWQIEDAEPLHAAAVNLQGFAFLLLYAALTVLVWGRFGAPYGLFAALSVAVPLSISSERWPLLSLPRFGVVVFPFFLALATLGARSRTHTLIVSASAVLLGITLVQWVTFQWVA